MKPKREKRTAAKRQSAHTRQWRLDVLARDGHRCTAILKPYEIADGRVFWSPVLLEFATGRSGASRPAVRCVEAAKHVHHRRNRNFGHELLEDGVSLCESHHNHIESWLRPFNRGRLGRKAS